MAPRGPDLAGAFSLRGRLKQPKRRTRVSGDATGASVGEDFLKATSAVPASTSAILNRHCMQIISLHHSLMFGHRVIAPATLTDLRYTILTMEKDRRCEESPIEYYENVTHKQISWISDLNELNGNVILKSSRTSGRKKKRQGHLETDHFDPPSQGELNDG
jgi:hypothetical protein